MAQPFDQLAKRPSPFGWYMINQVVFFSSTGIGLVLFPWLVAVVLEASPQLVGAAQAMMMMPMLLFLLVGGAKADRSHLQSWMMRLYALGVIPPTILCILLLTDSLTYAMVVLYAVCMSTIGAFLGPARDSLLTRVTQTDTDIGMQRAVGLATAGQFGAQFIGIALAGQADNLGAATLVAMIGIGYALCIAVIGQLPDYAVSTSEMAADGGEEDNAQMPDTAPSTADRIAEIREGLEAAWSSDRIRPTILMIGLSGFLFMGAVMVYLPLMIRDVYAGGAFEISLLFVCFFGGIGVSSTFLSQRPLENQGQALMIAASAGAFAMACFFFEPPLWLFFGIVTFWGLSGGVSMSMSRTIVQRAAPEKARARVLSVFLLAMLGTGPVGSVLYGFVINTVGLAYASLMPVILMLIVWPAMYFKTDLWHLKAKGASY